MISSIGEKLLKIAKKLDDAGHYKLADSITQTMVRLSQFAPYNNPFADPQSLEPYLSDNTLPMELFSNLKGTEYYKNLPYYMSKQYQRDVITNQDNSKNFLNNTLSPQTILQTNNLTPQEKDLINTYAVSCVYSGQPIDTWISQHSGMLNPKLLPLFKQVCENFPKNNYMSKRPLTPLEAYNQRNNIPQQKPQMQYVTYNMADPSKSGPAAGTVFNSTNDTDFRNRLKAVDNPYWTEEYNNSVKNK